MPVPELQPDEKGLFGMEFEDASKEGSIVKELTEEEKVVEKKLVRKLDLILLPLFTLLYLLNMIDRSAVGNIFYIGCEVPSNLVLKKVGGKWVSVLTIGFGVVTLASAFMKNFAEFIVIRALLGAFEGGTLPGIAFLFSRFYKRDELVFRIGTFLSLGPALSGAFGGLIAGGLVSTGDIGSVVGWRKIFLVEGIITTSLGVLSIFVVPDGPANARWLTVAERDIGVRRLAVGVMGVSTSDKTSSKIVKRSFMNLQTWMCALGYSFINIVVQGAGLFLPTIIKTLGNYSATQANLRTVPPYVVATFWSIFVSYGCYRTRRHGYWIAGSVSLSCIGYIIFLTSRNSKVLYFATFITFSGAAPETARAVTSGIVPGFGSIGSIIATWAYLAKTAPHYVPGNALNVGATAGAAATALFLVWYTKHENRLRERGGRDYRLEGLSADEANELGSAHPNFRYMS
ncbi:major facilitator superfamily protein [Pseudohyphozyma bogoriensis]|nr:major facilitator superfamily protein [Pseudohyphozyma bogoriensis]